MMVEISAKYIEFPSKKVESLDIFFRACDIRSSDVFKESFSVFNERFLNSCATPIKLKVVSPEYSALVVGFVIWSVVFPIKRSASRQLSAWEICPAVDELLSEHPDRASIKVTETTNVRPLSAIPKA